MPQDFDSILNKIRDCMDRAGEFSIGETAISDCDPEQLLAIMEETVHEHWKIHAAALAYYSHLFNMAQTELEDLEAKFNQAIMREKGVILKIGKEEYNLSRPSKEDIHNLAIVLSEKEDSPLRQDFNEMQESITYYKAAVRDLKSWVEVWEKKGFSLNGLTSVTSPQKFHN
jgi:hypothetical protein